MTANSPAGGFRLTAEQRTDIIAYILSLRQSGSQPGK